MDNGVDRLDGWKEISSYLRCDIRTCLRWEKDAGLPIHRLNTGTKRAKVFAYKAELDRWMAGDHGTAETGASARRVFWLPFAIGGVAVLLAALFAWAVWPSSPGPVECRARGQTLVCFDAQGRDLWQHDVDSPVPLGTVLEDGDLPYPEPVRQRFVLQDIDGDGKKEVAIFDYQRDASARGVVVLDHDGDELWRQPVSFNVKYRVETPGSNFRPFQLEIQDLDGDGSQEVLALWAHEKFHPGIFDIFAADRGDRVFQYSHTGLLQSFHFFAGEHRRQILLGGTNNLLDGDAVLVVLDVRDLRSGLGPPYDLPAELAARAADLNRFVPVAPRRGGQLKYLRFPHNQLSRANGTTWMNVYEILADDAGYSIQVDCGLRTPAYFKFDAAFNLTGVQPGTGLRAAYEAHLAAGRVSQPLEQFLAGWLQSIQQWDGEDWAPVPILP